MSDPAYPIQKGDATVAWGADGIYEADFIQSGSSKRTAQKKTLADSEGNTGAVVFFDGSRQVSVEFARKTTQEEIHGGDSITIAGVAALVDDVDVKYANADFQMLTVTATAYDKVSAVVTP